jgi:hypothetical protein
MNGDVLWTFRHIAFLVVFIIKPFTRVDYFSIMAIQSATNNELYLERIPERELSARQRELRDIFFGRKRCLFFDGCDCQFI